MDTSFRISSTAHPDSPLAASCQLLVVEADDWASTTAELQRFARESIDSDWQAVGKAIPVSLGRSGLAWGIGLHGETGGAAPRKREGDGCAPAGIFAITELFGTAPPNSDFASHLHLPYRQATPDIVAVDDPASAHYNRIIDRRQVPAPDWLSHEEMLRADERYVVGAFIAHNSPQPVPGAGSCIFLHVWQAPGVPTAGCTAGSLDEIREICQWLDGAAAPLLVQLPRSEFARCGIAIADIIS